ncbi:MAG: leucine--tRNA ligase, partial [Planctomycetota bacterium]
VTCRPDYYRWSQWLFLLLYERGLAYRASSYVNWCPSCKTVLANEQVVGGECERCHESVEMRDLEQWFFKTTEYAQRLLDGLDGLPDWPDNIKAMQRNWIGRSKGCRVVFPVPGEEDPIEVFTTRPDTLYGVTFMAVAPECPLARRLVRGTDREAEVEAYIAKALARSEMDRSAEETEKDGVDTGRVCTNPLTGEEVRIFVADYVLAGYGSGLVMGVPAHDQRDFEFARKYDITIKVVIRPPDADLTVEEMEAAYVDPGVMVNSGPFDGIPSTEGIERVCEHLQEKGLGGPAVEYRLRDWLISRQRYWGTPIPMIHCEGCGIVPVVEEDLPVVLPESVTDFIPKGRSPLADVPEFMDVVCPKCGKPAQRDPDTMDTFMCSSWYQLRYADARNGEEIFSREAIDTWLPVDLYIGGAEHATGHLIYFRFITKVLQDAGLLSFPEPALALVNHGMVKDEKGDVMSKRAGNASSPVELMEEHGVDALRIAMFEFAPTRDDICWEGSKVFGARRWLARVHETVTDVAPRIADVTESPAPDRLGPGAKEVRRRCHVAIRRVTEGLQGDLKLNTAISAVRELVTELRAQDLDALAADDLPAIAEATRALVRIMAPTAPHLAEELHRELGGESTVFRAGWPSYDEDAARAEEVEMAVQVNGKVRGRFTVAADTPEDEVVALAKELENVARHLEGKEIVKVIFVAGRNVNLVVR